MKKVKLFLISCLILVFCAGLGLAIGNLDGRGKTAHAASAASLKTTIEGWNHNGTGTLSAVVAGDTVTVTGTVTGVAGPQLGLSISENVTVVWAASITGAQTSGSMISKSGLGTLEIVDGAHIQTSFSSNAAVRCWEGPVKVSGGTVIGADEGIACWNDPGNASVEITGGTISGGNDAVYAAYEGCSVTVTGGTFSGTRFFTTSNGAVIAYSSDIVGVTGSKVNCWTGAIVKVDTLAAIPSNYHGTDNDLTLDAKNGGVAVGGSSVKWDASGSLAKIVTTVPGLTIPTVEWTAVVASDAYTLFLHTDGTLHQNTSGGAVASVPGVEVSGSASAWVLTLEDVFFWTSAPTTLEVPAGTTITLIGDNVIKSAFAGSGNTSGIILYESGDITINGAGSLTVLGGDTTGGNSYGINAGTAGLFQNINIGGDAVVTALAGDATGTSFGIHAAGAGYGKVTITDNAEVTAIGGTEGTSCGISSISIIFDGKQFVASGENSAITSTYTVPNGYEYYVNATTAPSGTKLMGNGTSTTIGSTHKYAKVVYKLFVPVTSIDITSALEGTVGTPITLSGTVNPGTATNQTITWARTGGDADASVVGGVVSATTAGTVEVRATVEDGTAVGIDYNKWFDITFSEAETYTVTVTNGTGGGEYEENDIVTITAEEAPEGYEFDEWVIESGDITLANANSASTTFTMIAGAVEVTATYKLLPEEIYTVDEQFGAWTGAGDATAEIAADHTKFVKLMLNGAEVSSSNYTVTEGSTVITLKESYLKTLSNGTHNFVAMFDGGVSGTITLTVNVSGDGGLGTGAIIGIVAGVVAALAIGGFCVYRFVIKKKKTA